jgi:F-type H+-transporting ATPase subunit b
LCDSEENEAATYHVFALCCVTSVFGCLQEIENLWKQGRLNDIASYTDAVEAEKKEQWRAEGQKDLFAAKKENVALQLEAAYRERLMTAFNDVCYI